MIQVKHIDPDDLALYAMQLLTPEEMAEMRIHLQHSAEARQVLADYLADLAIVAHTAEMHSPAAQARQRLMKHVAREKKIIPMQLLERAPADSYAPRESSSLLEMEPPRKSAAARVLPWVGWALAAGMLLPVFNMYQEREQLKSTVAVNQRQLAESQATAALMDTVLGTAKDPSAVHVKLTSTGTPPPPEGRATYVASKGALLFIASNLAPLEEGKTYELWVVPKGGDAPLPAGTFRPDVRGNSRVVMPKLPVNVEAAAIAVTIENEGGSTTPTKPLILQGLPAAVAGE